MKSKFAPLAPARVKFFRLLICLLGVAMVSLWFFVPKPRQPETIPTRQTASSWNPQIPHKEQLQRKSIEPKPSNESAAEILPELETTLTSPDELEDLDEIREWARQNPAEALTWALKATPGEKQNAVAEIACAIVAESDPAKAVALAEGFALGYGGIQENLVQQWAAQDAAAAFAHATSKPAGDTRDRLVSRVAFVLSKENPIEAAKIVAEQIAPGEIQHEAALSVLHQWALHDGNAAAEWAQLFSDETLRDRAISEIKRMAAGGSAAEGSTIESVPQ
jgi:hypothetical protein